MKKLLFLSILLSAFTSNVYAETTDENDTILSQNADGTNVISKMTSVPTLESEPSTAGKNIKVKKYGIADRNGTILIEPILDFVSLFNAPFEIVFDENGFSEAIYDAAYYYYAGQDTLWTPAETKKILINSNYKTWESYDTFYDNFITENRFIVKGEGKSVLVDGDLNKIADSYTHIIELDDGKWYASTDPSATAPVYSIVLDNDGNEIADFDPLVETKISAWAEPYIEKANELGITTTGKTTAFNTSFFTEKVTRIEFCRLAVNTLMALQFELPRIENYDVFTDTNDENVLICYELGIISGVGNEKFNPYGNMTREAAARILVSLAEVLDIALVEKSDVELFADFNTASDWAKEYILQVTALKTTQGERIMAGTSETTFSPLQTYTTEQSVATLVRMVDLKKESIA
ncbi:MAG: S-layer homology domain-containing protein [Bacillota bacterium]